MSEPIVVVDGVVKLYRRRGGVVHAVDGVSLAIDAGGTLGLVGESGSGKSTLARLLLGLERPTSGTITVAGRSVGDASHRELRRLRRDVQIVLQDPVGSLNRRKTVEQIVELPLLVHGVKPAAARRARVRVLLDLVGLDASFGRRYPASLSGGQCQRVGIARALALEPRVLLLDEAVSALDVSVRAQILNLLRDLQEQLALTYLFISHDLAVVRYMAPRIAVMHDGRIVELAERERLFAEPQDPYTRELIAAVPAPGPDVVHAPPRAAGAASP